MKRRAFLGSMPALPLAARAGALPAPQAEQGRTHSSFDPWVELNAANVRHNVAEIARLTKRPILAVIKNNGYGAGVVEIARVLEPLDAIHGYAVVKIDEAFRLRDAGLRKPVLLMGPFDDRQLRDLAARDVMPMIYRQPGKELEAAAGALNRPVKVHLCVDTGLGRVGVPYRDAAALVSELRRRASSAAIDGTMMTFTEDAAFDREQLRRFTSLCDELTAGGAALGRRHAASCFTLFQGSAGDGGLGPFLLDMVRPGMAIFGVYSETPFRTAGVLDLKPAVALRARVVYVKRLPKGESAGYNRAYAAQRDTWVATLPVGHADGVPRVLAKGGKVRIGGTLYPIVASVSASHMIVEIGPADSGQPPVNAGDPVTIFDWQDGSRPEDISAACGASVYDLLMHLNPALPRTLAQPRIQRR
jgi:alanine racemase